MYYTFLYVYKIYFLNQKFKKNLLTVVQYIPPITNIRYLWYYIYLLLPFDITLLHILHIILYVSHY